MKADNGVYILETPNKERSGYEYRVAELSEINNLDWDYEKCRMVNDPDTKIKNARCLWKKSEVFTDMGKALIQAHHTADNLNICKYGVSIIRINRIFGTKDTDGFDAKIEITDYSKSHLELKYGLNKIKSISISYDGGRFSITDQDGMIFDGSIGNDFSIVITQK